ncbi:MAG: VOC family protein, partial [Candidatus Binatia bacterium]
HYGYVTDAIDQVASDFKQKGGTILRENRDDSGRLTTIFVKDPNGLELEIRSPR